MVRSRNTAGPSPKGVIVLVAIVLGVLLGISLFASFLGGWRSVPVDKIGLHYTGGPFQGVHFAEEINPGTHTKFLGLKEHLYLLPSTQRTYTISKNPNVGDVNNTDFLNGVSNDGVPFTFEGVLYLKLNTNPQVIRQFFEQVCLHDNCWDLSRNGGWDKMLGQYVRPQIENAVRTAVPKFNRDQLIHDPDAIVALQTEVAKDLQQRITTVIGGEYFCGPDSTRTTCTPFEFLLKDPTPPQSVLDAYTDNATQAQLVASAKSKAEAKKQEALGDAARQSALQSAPALSPEQLAYLQIQATQTCAASPNCTLVITDGGTGINVNTATKK